MAPNGTTSRKSQYRSFLRRMPHLTSIAAPAAAPKPVKSEDAPTAIPLGNLFDDLDDKKADVKEEVRKTLPALEKPGSWDSKVTGGWLRLCPPETWTMLMSQLKQAPSMQQTKRMRPHA